MKTYKAEYTILQNGHPIQTAERAFFAHDDEDAENTAQALRETIANEWARYDASHEYMAVMEEYAETEGDEAYPVRPTKIAAYIVAQVIMNQGDANWVMYFDEIEAQYPVLEGTNWRDNDAYLDEIKDELHRYPQFEDNDETAYYEKGEEGFFDCCAWTNYIASEYDAE